MIYETVDMSKQSNILDPIHATLAPAIWDAPASTRPKLKLEHKMWVQKTVFDRFNESGYDVQNWASLYVTGSITTYQYSDESDFDVSLFVNSEIFPEWSRAEMIGIAVEQLDGSILPRTSYPLQVFIVPEGVTPSDLYKRGLRSGYDLERDQWVNPPDPDMAEDPSVAYNSAYVYALEQADKMERLLRYEPHKAQTLWHQIHRRRRADQKAGKGDYAPSNIVYKMLANRGLLDEISDVTGEYIAKTKASSGAENWDEILKPWAAEWDSLSEEALDSIIRHAPQIYRQLAESGLLLNCNKACELWLGALLADGIQCRILGGTYNSDPDSDRGDHTWLEVEGRIVDPTAGQFARGADFLFENYNPQHYWDAPIGEEMWHRDWPELDNKANLGRKD